MEFLLCQVLCSVFLSHLIFTATPWVPHFAAYRTNKRLNNWPKLCEIKRAEQRCDPKKCDSNTHAILLLHADLGKEIASLGACRRERPAGWANWECCLFASGMIQTASLNANVRAQKVQFMAQPLTVLWPWLRYSVFLCLSILIRKNGEFNRIFLLGLL